MDKLIPIFEETKMNKMHIGILFGIFALASFVALNLYTSTSYIGYGTNAPCNECHNQPALVQDVNGNFAMSNFTQAEKVFNNGEIAYGTDEVPTVQTNNRSVTQFDTITFLRNSTDVMVRAQVADKTYTVKGSGSSTSDKFGIIFNIDVVNFTVGDFLTSYNSTETNLNNVLVGQMAFTSGHADFWYVDVNTIGTNATGMAQNGYIAGGVNFETAAQYQTIYVSVWYGNLGHGSIGYRYYFVRALNTGDSNDAQFNVDGTAIHYAIASWNASQTDFHLSSFDKMIIVGNSFNVIKTVTSTATTTQTETTTQVSTTTVTGQGSSSNTSPSYTLIFVLAGLLISIPFISRMRNRKE